MFFSSICLSTTNQVPLHRQLYLELRRMILSGTLASGRKLPSTRALARQKNLARGTIALAYRQLIADGYAETFTGSGTYVRREYSSKPTPQSTVPSKDLDVESGQQESLSLFGRSLLDCDLESRVLEREDIIDFTPTASAAAAPVRQLRNHLATRLNYTSIPDFCDDPQGDRQLREAIADRLSTWRGLDFMPERIVIVGDNIESLNLIAKVHIDEGDTVAIENPSYAQVRRVFAANGARLCPISVDRAGMKVQELLDYTSQLKLVYATPNYQVPLGSIMSDERRRQLVSFARATGSVIVEDDYGSEYDEDRVTTSLCAIDKSAPIALRGTFSRLLYPSTRLGYLVVPQLLVPVYSRAKKLLYGQDRLVEQRALAEFIMRGHLDNLLREKRELYRLRRNLLLEELAKQFGDEIEINGCRGGTHVVVRFHANYFHDDCSIIDRALRNGVAITSTSGYYQAPQDSNRDNSTKTGKESRGEFMICYVNLSNQQIIDGVERLADAIKKHHDFSSRTSL